MLKPEDWRAAGSYLVNRDGTVWSTLTNKFLRPKKSKNGYLIVILQGETRFVHELVATTWFGPRPSEGHVVDHKDANKENNSVSNLEWVTRQENALRAYTALSKRPHGVKATLTAEQVYEARRRASDGYSLKKLAEDFKVTEGTARNAVYGVTYADLTEVPPLVRVHEPGTWRPGAGGKTHEGPHQGTDEHPAAFVEPLQNEEWKRLQGDLSGYWVSSNGRVFSTKSRRLMNPQTTGQGYLRVQLRTPSGHQNKMIHVLVAENFLPPKTEEGFIVGHLNENPQDPRASNLAWISRRENAQRAHVAKTRNMEVIDLQNFLSTHVAIERLVRIEGVILDAFVPERKTGIILDDIRQTSELSGVIRSARVQAMHALEKAGVRLLRVFSNEWLTKRELVNSMLLNKLGKTATKIMARSTTVQEVTVQEASAFLNQNHLQGTIGSRVKLGCYHNGRLVALATFGQQRYGDSPDCFELLRFANLSQHYVVGGFSKILSHFKRNYQAKSLVSFADRRWSSGGMYENSGFTLKRASAPNYFYFRPDSPNDLHSRVVFQKHKLKDKLAVFDDSLTEFDNMKANGWDRIWDCGNLVYEMTL